MRKATCGGSCADCGTQSADGLYWVSVHKVLDFGPGTGADGEGLILEGSMLPERCDRCEGEYLKRTYPHIYT